MTRMPSDDDIEALRRALAQQADTISQLTARLDAHAPLNSALSPNFPHGKPLFAFREIHNLSRQSIDSTHSVTFTIDYDQFIAKLHVAKLQLRFSNVRSNVSAATSAAGGGTTATSTGGGGTTATSSSGGAQTSSSAASHTHTITGSTTFGAVTGLATVWDNVASGAASGNTGTGTSHNHSSATTDATDTAVVGTNHAHTVSGGSGSESSHTHSLGSHTHVAGASVQVGNSTHTHAITLPTSDASGSHSHTVVDHTHTVTLLNHTHDVTISTHTHSITLTYGIFEQAYVNPGLSISINGVDRTAALGGPWNAAPSELDITEYLRETSGDPVRGTIPIVFTVAASLLDIEATLKSIVFGSDLVQAGV